MKKKQSIGLVSLLMAFVLVIVGCGNEGAREAETEAEATETELKEDWPTTLRFADTGLEGMEELQRAFGPFQEKLEEVLEVDVEFFPVSDRTIATNALEFDQVDIVLAGPSEYAQIKSAIPGVEPIVAIERDEYNAVIIVHEDSEYETLDDIKGSQIAMKDAGSTSGHIGPSAMLVEAGFDLDNDVEILLLDAARIEAFTNHEVDVLATGIKDYHSMVEEDGEGKYRILEEGPPLPADPFVVSPNLPEDFVVEMQQRLLDNKDEIIESILSSGERDKYMSARIIEILDSDYDLMRETYSVLGIDL
ncbi:Phosphonate ABC transporter phosphate-binding periplasmic component [Alkalibacterium sp. AK22]|uniref:phosphate/phosphite/phosphonate ABC transporter substrate-binding protein n=1 Tax=Alkalibacterium sp. AK22 TaxID=1229520 RepID=UPI0004516DDD|nr:phosphate/phosphite/phosphonate ABC transporter substrate-binding protein [Alkalibacterium sp. AK22]EXJ23921.1 Phosphonate ABC transporter phosphate-binding periplasmic component [Alkalibacterium sp. AK22]